MLSGTHLKLQIISDDPGGTGVKINVVFYCVGDFTFGYLGSNLFIKEYRFCMVRNRVFLERTINKEITKRLNKSAA